MSAKWLAVALLAIIAACLLIEAGASMASARPEAQAPGRAPAVLAVAGQITRDGYGLYLVDLQNHTICVYQWLPTTRKLRLAAARTYTYDRQLDAYNTEPAPSEIAELVAQARRLDKPPARD